MLRKNQVESALDALQLQVSRLKSNAIGPDGNPTPEAYEDAKQELIFLKKQNETITINGKKYKAIKEEKTLKEQSDRLFTNRTVI